MKKVFLECYPVALGELFFRPSLVTKIGGKIFNSAGFLLIKPFAFTMKSFFSVTRSTEFPSSAV